MSEELLQSQLNKSRQDKFLLVLNLPLALKNINSDILSQRQKTVIARDALQFSVYGSIVPTIAVPSEIAAYGGQSYKVSSHTRPAYDDITVDFTVDNKFNNYWVIYKWLDLLNDEAKSYYDAKNITDKKIAPSTYQSDFTLYGLDEFDQPAIKFTYTKAFPVLLAPITYSYRAPNEIESQFTFSFSQFLTDLV